MIPAAEVTHPGLDGNVGLMNDDAQGWQLVEGQRLLAELVVMHGDLAWVNPQVRAAERFERVWPPSEEELG